MNDSNQFPNQGFAAYNRPSATPPRAGIVEKIFGPRVAMRFRNPLVATGALLLVGAAFAGVIIASYPGDDADENVPVIMSETTSFKDAPEMAGGMDIPFQDSTIFTSMREGSMEETAPIENLLAQEEPVDRFAMIDAAEEEAASAAAAIVVETEPAAGTEATETSTNEAAPEAVEAVVEAVVPEVKPFEIQKIEQKTEKIPPKDLMAAADSPEKPEQIYAAGSSPETLDFVRSVLDGKDTKKVLAASATNVASRDAAAAQVAAIEPAAGSIAASAIEPGEYFVQLASVTSTTGAESEWGKIQKRHGTLLQNVTHRVKRADLDKGTFYRIQAGPMSKDAANRLCDSIKAEKPGGCLVVR